LQLNKTDKNRPWGAQRVGLGTKGDGEEGWICGEYSDGRHVYNNVKEC